MWLIVTHYPKPWADAVGLALFYRWGTWGAACCRMILIILGEHVWLMTAILCSLRTPAKPESEMALERVRRRTKVKAFKLICKWKKRRTLFCRRVRELWIARRCKDNKPGARERESRDDPFHFTWQICQIVFIQWGIETFYGAIKGRLYLENFTGKSVEAVKIFMRLFL